MGGEGGGRTFDVKMASIEAALTKSQKIEPKLLQTKSLCYTIIKNAPRVLLPHSAAEERKPENFDFVILLSSSLSSSSRVTRKP